MSHYSLVKLLALISLVGTASATDQTFRARTGFYGPCSQILYARPTLKWEIWSEQGLEVTASEMKLNGSVVASKYDPEARALAHQPPQPLSPGDYQVECKVTLAGRATFKQKWITTIAPNAIPNFAPSTPAQMEALTLANKVRRDLGLPELRLDECLNAAAIIHSEYLAANNEVGHSERPGQPKFFAESGGDRLAKLGWGGPSWEVVSQGERELSEAMQNLFDAPYHRIAFMQPGLITFGSGRVKDKTTIEMGGTSEEGVIVSPADGQTNVQRLWIGTEVPDPLRIHQNASQPVGYPIVLVCFQKDNLGLSNVKAELTSGGQAVPFYLNHPGNDPELQMAVFIIPIKPLKPKTSYTASVTGVDASGHNISRTWTFTTAG
jgi:uncharacterized protein YkwD